jgi:hypothetical protein
VGSFGLVMTFAGVAFFAVDVRGGRIGNERA